MAQRGPGRRQAPGQERPGWPPTRGTAAATSARGMTEPPSPGHPEEKAEAPAGAGHGGLPGAAAAAGRWCWRRAARSRSTGLAAGCVPSGFPGPRDRVLPAAGVPALPHHLRRAPRLQHLPNHLQDCLPPPRRAGPRQAALRLLPRLDADPRAPRGLRSSDMPAAVPERRALCPAGTLPLPGRVAGRQLSDRSARGGAGGGAEAAVPGGRAGAEAAAGAGPPAQPGLAGAGPGAAGPRPLPGALLPAAGPHRLPERAGVLPGGAAGVLFLQEGAVTARLLASQLCTPWEMPPPLLPGGAGPGGPRGPPG